MSDLQEIAFKTPAFGHMKYRSERILSHSARPVRGEYVVANLRLIGAIALSLTLATPAMASYRDSAMHGDHRYQYGGNVYVSNGSFDWRHERPNWQVPWYAYDESGHCFVWTPNAYHYACDPNSRY